MMTSFITFRSITFAQRGEGVLRQAGIRCVLQRTPKKMEEQGCGYCLRLRPNDVERALQRLREGNVSFRKVYTGEDGPL